MRIGWFDSARRALLRLPWREATRVDGAIQRYAATARGDVYKLAVDDAVTVRLRVAPHAVRLIVDPLEPAITVVAVYRLE